MPEIARCLELIRDNVLACVPPYWPALRETLDRSLPRPLTPHALLPLIMTRAAGGELGQGVPFATIWTLISTGVRLLDDCADQDDPQALTAAIGLGRTLNYGGTLMHLGAALIHALPAKLGRREILDDFFSAALQAAYGQDRDLTAPAATIEEYIRLVEDKTCAAFAFACASGARSGGGSPEVVAVCRQAGAHLGMMLQLLDDLESAWLPDPQSDLAHGRRTFPVWHGLTRGGPHAAELRALVFGPEPGVNAPRIRHLLTEVGVRRSVLWAALEERDRARRCLEGCPGEEGRGLFATYLDVIFRDF